ncbi:hypothetical protein F8M41_015122 [Gigaspora margarita]|uniref:Uncharacterized protein n=1 Tax=Gigaspora margarita TaxID=4874 RepID=A0A8H4AQW9_GIGMA|nr:hypothetical protein F8M41_015122 [Gigaspora margarita]
MDNGFDITNDKAFKEDMIKGAAKALIEKVIYPENSQIKSEAEKYVRENYAEYFKKFILKDWNVYYVNNIHGHFCKKLDLCEEQRSKRKNNSNYSNKVNKRPRVKLVDLDPEEVQEAENDPNEDVNKEKDMDDYEKNMDNDK